ncbi:integumentary mucin C.1-like isoform X2 [Oncorhynchus masou masou]|uniref:integumentary mucin C.1-like isoform X2 n=1 Tax=Oncorhynchus masou masou TaxID=90313 RepID=UPI003184632B
MYWKILTAVLCFYAVVPASPTTTGNATTTATAANTTSTYANNITTTANTTTTAAPTTTIAAPTTTPSPPVVFDLVFRSDEVFSPALTNTSSPLFQSLVTKTIQALEPLFKAHFPNFIRLIVVGFRNGSIITDTQLEFAAANTTANATTPFADAVATTLKAAITNGSLSINISANFKITVKPTPSAASPTTTGNATTTTTAVPTTTTAANTTTTAANTTTTAAVAPTTTAAPNVLLLVFSSDETFTETLSNNTSQAFQDRATTIKNEIEPVYRKVFRSFIQLVVLSFRRGSIITESRMEFGLTGNGTAPTANSVKDTLVDAVNEGSIDIRVNTSSIVVSATPTSTGNTKTTTTAVPTTTTAVPTTTADANTTTTAANTTTTAAKTTTTAANTTTTAANTTTTAANTTSTSAKTTTTAANNITTAVPKTATAANTTTTAAPTTTPLPTFVLNLVFRSDEAFSPALTNTSSPLFQSLVTKTIQALEPLFKAHFPNFIRLIVVGFRSGSIITDTQLEFAAANTTANATTPFADAVATTLKAAITNGSLSINISANFNITVPANPTTAAPTTTTAAPLTTTAAPTTTTNAPTTNTAAPLTTTAAPPTTTSAPTTTTRAPTTTTRAPTTTTAALQTTTAAVAPTTTAAPNVLLLVFSSDETFTETLSNNTSQAFRDRATTIKNKIEPVYRKVFRSFIQLVVLSFRRGSIITESRMEFGLTGNGTAPTANSVKDTLVDAVNEGSIDIRVNTSSIVVSVLKSSMSPVVNSVFSSFGMTLVFLLLSAAMHRL